MNAPHLLRWAASVLMTGALVAPVSVQAQLFADDQARRAVVELRGKLSQLEDLNRAQAEEIAALRRALIDFNNQAEQLRAELARQQGAREQLARDVSELQLKQRDVLAAVDDRVRKLEPTKVQIDGREAEVDPQEKRAFEDALAVLRSGEFAQAATRFSSFFKRFPNTPYLETAQFWYGNALYGKRDYKEAIAAFKVTAAKADHPKAPEALLALANCQVEMKDSKAAKVTLAYLIKQHPQSEAAKAAKDRLAGLR